MTNETIRYPIGRFSAPGIISPEQRQQYITEIAKLPHILREAVERLTDVQLDTPYREGGWTVRQLVHHIPDSHINSYVRFKWALTEDRPTIKAYFEDRWAELPDTRHTPVEVSIRLLEALHQRWVVLLKSLQEEDWQKAFIHPETHRAIRLDTALGMYAWHGKHHVAHIQNLKDKMGW